MSEEFLGASNANFGVRAFSLTLENRKNRDTWTYHSPPGGPLAASYLPGKCR